jgi:phosphopantetheine adenylyltransferase
VASRERISVELDTEVVSRLRAQAVEANVSEGEIVERALQVADLRALVGQIRSRSDLDEEASMKLVREELKAARADARNRAA